MPLTPLQLNFVETYILRGAVSANPFDDRITPPPQEDVNTLRQSASRILQSMQGLATPPEATGADQNALETARKTITGHLDDPPTIAGVRAAAMEIKAMSALHTEVLDRVRLDREARSARKIILLTALSDVPDLTDPDALPKDRQELDVEKQAATSALSGNPPLTVDLETAQAAIDRATRLIDTVTTRIAQERTARTARKIELLRLCTAATFDDDAEDTEKEHRAALLKAVQDPLASDVPSGDDIALSGDSLVALTTYVDGIKTALEQDRRPRFTLATKAKASLDLIDVTLPENTPQPNSDTIEKTRKALSETLDRLADWANVTTWQASALDGMSEKITNLGTSYADLRQRVAEASEKLRLALEGARNRIDSPTQGGAFSTAQLKELNTAFEEAEKAAKVDILAADTALTDLASLTKRAAGLSRIRADLDRRITAVAQPAAATTSELSQWTALKNAATQARDEVLTP